MVAKKRPKYNENSAIRSALRRAFSRSPIVREVLMAGRREVPKYNKDGSLAKKPSVQYHCETCGEWVSSTKVNVDHVDPVVPITGFTDWNTFIARLWCAITNLKRICSTCHDQKTAQERVARKQFKESLDGPKDPTQTSARTPRRTRSRSKAGK